MPLSYINRSWVRWLGRRLKPAHGLEARNLVVALMKINKLGLTSAFNLVVHGDSTGGTSAVERFSPAGE